MENQKAKISPNFFLLLKQGFKGIFKFRIQFIIILILSFLATLVLTLSVSTSRRLESAYHNIVEKITPFDLMGTTKISNTATGNLDGAAMEDFRSTALTDFINNTFVNAQTPDEKTGLMTNTSSYNFILNQNLYENSKSFLTKVIDNQTSAGFYELTKKYYTDLNDPEADEEAIALILKTYKWDLKENFADQLIKDLIAYRNNPQDENVSYLVNTSFGFLLKNNPRFFDFVGQDFVKANYYNFKPDEQRFIRYLYWIGAQIASWIATQEATFSSLIFDEGQSETEKAEIFYEFLTGKTFNQATPIKENFIVHDNNDTYTLQATYNEEWDSTNAGKYLNVNDGTQIKPFVINDNELNWLANKGYRGITSPLSIKIGEIVTQENGVKATYQGIKDITFLQNYEEFSLLDRSQSKPLTRELSLKNEFSYDYDIMEFEGTGWNPVEDNTIKASMMQYHIELNALSAGFNVRFRKESIIFDNISSQKFRFVFLNGRDNANFTILRGTAPTAANEIAISQQYASANKIKVGQYLTINQSVMLVTGFGTDAFTFFPNADPDFPIPQPKTEAIIYGSKQTWTKIQGGNGEGTPEQNTNPQMFSFFLTNNKKEKLFDLTTKKNLFISLQMDLAKNLKNNFTYLQNLNQTQIHQQNLVAEENTNLPLESFFSLKNFQDSNYRLSWTLLPMVVMVFQIATYVASAVIGIIAVIALVICIRKTIHFNSKQIGILKAMGTNPWMIAVTYLAYSLVIMGVVVPVAWIIGTGLQVPFSMLFTQYFSAPMNMVLVDWISIVLTFFGFGLVTIATSMVAAYLVTRKPVVEIIDHSVKWSNSKFIDRLKAGIFKNATFNYRFSLTLTSSGKKPIALLVIVVGLTSLLISGAIAVPAIANKVISSYYKSVNYANAYDNNTPTVNSPLSKTALNFWQGNEKWDKDWHDANLRLDSTSTPYGYYLDPEGYMDSASQASPIPKYVFFNNLPGGNDPLTTDIVQNFTYSYAYLLKNPTMFLTLASQAFGDNFFTVLGQTFNIGTIDQFFGLILNADYETIREFLGANYDENISLDANKQKLAFAFAGSLTLALPNLLSVIFSATSGGPTGGGTGADWKRDVINVILTQTPPYVRGYIEKSNSRTEQFAISFNAEPYVPKKESFVTKFMASTNEYNDVQFIGIDDNQTAFTMKEEDNKRLFLDSETLTKIQKIMDGHGAEVADFWAGGVHVWNGTTLTLPMLDNHQSAAGFHLKKDGVLSNIATTTRQLKFHTTDGKNPWKVLPKNAWAYDDADFRNSNLYQDPLKTLKLENFKSDLPDQFNKRYQDSARSNNGYNPENVNLNQGRSSWLDVYALENSKFTYQDVFDQNQILNDATYFFNDFAFDNNYQISGSYTRPFYQYKNIELFLPIAAKNSSILVDEKEILESMDPENQGVKGPDAKWYYKTHAQDQLKLENGNSTNEYSVPDSVLKAWGLKREDNPEFLVIRPYDLRYTEKGSIGGGLDRLINGGQYPYWLRYAFDSEIGPGALTYNNEEPVVYGAYLPDATPFKINFQVVGTIDSYDSKLLLIDQTLANMVLGYSTARTVGAANTYLINPKGPDTSPEHGQDKPRPWPDQLNTYDFKRPQFDVLVQNDRARLAKLTYLKNLKDANNYQPLKWHTGKLSNIEEPINLTSSISFNVRDNLGQYSLGLNWGLGLGISSNISGQTLLSTQKALINQIYSLAIGIGALLIIAIVITSSLLIMLVGDIYIAQYLRFMILMRALGYSNRAVQSYAFGTVSVLSIIIWIGVTIAAWLIIFGIIKGIAAAGFAIPYGLSWWPPLVSFVITFVSFFGSLLISSGKVRRGEVSDLVNESSE